jgi:hypothetical protein
MSLPSPDEMRRLTLIRHLYNLGISQSHEAEPRSGLALLPLHDAVEMFLGLACEHHAAGTTKKTTFMDYWDLLSKQGVPLTQKDGMQRLNTARVTLKHGGILCAAVELEGMRATTTNFLLENTKKAFGIEFHEISLVALVSDSEVAELLKNAEKTFASKGYTQTLVCIKCAFILSLRKHEEQRARGYQSRHRPSLLDSVLQDLSPFTGSKLSDALKGDAGRAARDLAEGTRKMALTFGEAISVLGYGLDFHSYLEFKANTPFVHELANGKLMPELIGTLTEDTETIQRCINFVVDTAIRLKI